MFSKSETGPLIGTNISASDSSSCGIVLVFVAILVGSAGIGGTISGGRSVTSTPPLGAFVAYDRCLCVLNIVLCVIIEVFESLLKVVLNRAARQFGSAFLLIFRP